MSTNRRHLHIAILHFNQKRRKLPHWSARSIKVHKKPCCQNEVRKPSWNSNRTQLMSCSFIQRVDSAAPAGYETPAWPSLYWPLPLSSARPFYLYNPSDIWRFTTTWTLLCFGTVHLVVAGWACIVQWRNWKLIWITPVLFAIIGGLEGLIAGSVVGGL
jgi:hypothetical protein